MAISSSDITGQYLDTGINTIVTPRANVEVEVHAAGEIDSGSKLTVPVGVVSNHVPHRHKDNPR